jgi:hypothetical protein
VYLIALNSSVAVVNEIGSPGLSVLRRAGLTPPAARTKQTAHRELRPEGGSLTRQTRQCTALRLVPSPARAAPACERDGSVLAGSRSGRLSSVNDRWKSHALSIHRQHRLRSRPHRGGMRQRQAWTRDGQEAVSQQGHGVDGPSRSRHQARLWSSIASTMKNLHNLGIFYAELR